MLDVICVLLVILLIGLIVAGLLSWFLEGFDVGVFLFTVFVSILVIVSCTIDSHLYKSKVVWENEWSTNIIALKDNSDIQGRMSGGLFVTTGYINEEMYYYCMENTTEGNHMLKIPANIAFIKETDEEIPHIIKTSNRWKSERIEFWLTSKSDEKYYIYVPVGTIDTTYNVNME